MYARLTGDRLVLYQWDSGQKLEVSPDVDRVDFHYRGTRGICYGVFAENGMVDIPDVLLQKYGVMEALLMSNADGVATVQRMEITVVERPLPPGYLITNQGNILSYDEFASILGYSGAILKDGSVMMEAALNMGGLNIVNLDEPENNSDAVNKGWADDKYLSKSGGTMTGRIYGLLQPIAETEPARKRDLDSVDTRLSDSLSKFRQDVSTSRKFLHNTVVAETAFAEDTAYADFKFRAAIPVEGVTTAWIPEVVFPVQDKVDYAPVAQAYDGGVYIWADDKPSGGVTIPTIILWRGDGA